MIDYLFSGCNRAECYLHCNLLYVCRERDLKEREGLFLAELELMLLLTDSAGLFRIFML